MTSLDEFGKGALAVIGAIIAVAIVSVIVSKKSDTPGALQALFTGLSSVVKSAVTPLPAPAAAATVTNASPSGTAGSDFWEGLMHFPLFGG